MHCSSLRVTRQTRGSARFDQLDDRFWRQAAIGGTAAYRPKPDAGLTSRGWQVLTQNRVYESSAQPLVHSAR